MSDYDKRPVNCRMRLAEENKPHPKSGCTVEGCNGVFAPLCLPDKRPENFANHPPSVTEIKSDQSPNGGTIWTARDVLIRTLRQIDNGMKIDALIVAYRIPNEEAGVSSISFKQASPDTQTSIGVLFEAMQLMVKD